MLPKGFKHSEETKKKMSITRKGKPRPYLKGKKHTEEHKRKIGKASKKMWENPEYRERMKKARRRKEGEFKHSEETKKKIKEKMKKIWQNENYRKHMSEVHKGFKQSQKSIQKRRIKMIGHSTSDETKLKISKSEKGKPISKETRQKLRIANIGKKYSKKTKQKHSISMKKLWKSSEYREKTLKAMLKNRSKKPTSYEKKIIDLCTKYDLPFKYVGDGEVILCGLNPDFIEYNGKKLLIEVYHPYYKLEYDGYNTVEDYENRRSETFAKYGYKTLFLNDKDLDIDGWEQHILYRINKFIGGRKI